MGKIIRNLRFSNINLETLSDFLIINSWNLNQDWTEFSLADKAPTNATGVILGVYVADSGIVGANTFFAIRNPDSNNLSEEFRVYPQTSGVWNMSVLTVKMSINKTIQYKVCVSGTFYVKVQIVGWIF